jgi:hypothetical protein
MEQTPVSESVVSSGTSSSGGVGEEEKRVQLEEVARRVYVGRLEVQGDEFLVSGGAQPVGASSECCGAALHALYLGVLAAVNVHKAADADLHLTYKFEEFLQDVVLDTNQKNRIPGMVFACETCRASALNRLHNLAFDMDRRSLSKHASLYVYSLIWFVFFGIWC